MEIQDLFRGNILTGQKEETWEGAIRRACEPLVKNHIIKEEYIDQVIDRELKWPTGFPLEPVGIALPHAVEKENILDRGIGVAVFPEGVQFLQSGQLLTTAEEREEALTAKIGIVFVMAIPDAGRQVTLYPALLRLFQDADVTKRLLEAKDEKEFLDVVSAVGA